MKWQIFAIGKPKLGFAAAGIEEYAGRLKPYAPVQLEWLKVRAGGNAGGAEGESEALLERSEGMFRVVLDERGEHIGSMDLAAKIEHWEQRSVKKVAVLIGGADGHHPALRARADWLWSLSKLTLQHEFALMLTLEQIYRAYTIKAGLPYHRE